MFIRRLSSADAEVFQNLRLQALQNSPSAFGASYEDERLLPLSEVEARLLERPGRAVFGGFDQGRLVAMAGLAREGGRKSAHKAFVWGVYVEPEMRGRGWAPALLRECLAFARATPGILLVNLSVNADNRRAHDLYATMGFQPFGREPGALLIDGCLHDEIHMQLRLGEPANA
ncbi:GNAT family N-acetyltransferase [Chromobacterium sp. IIBBL 290-4]|uniref:GNAT family N-acetyltransferase n=1 Tax=Chromobacterium sp. IIBBL 290-4 TaxID=2953890 RepID=UPI0020B6CBFD|nr:GNAT family N-acetyltransferase [Chromobacterium sp. IIBBL 290-4]UTH72904.1 GNAT family N-acetyltransferase [Chromobacterium sp. IIBBL 290-4]